jgi:predicted DsbA family dithiol-disulfide isomerase
MEVNIWSDIRCPFCYIGKRKFEKGLSQFKQKDGVEVIWRSFELDPAVQTDTKTNVYDYLAIRQGQSHTWSVQMHSKVKKAGLEVGLDYDFDKTILANSFSAHRLIQLAKTKKLDDAAEEALFDAHFVRGMNIDDAVTLNQIGLEIGLPAEDLDDLLSSDRYAKEVRLDEDMANQLGISGVPFFVINNQYAISGAQSPEIFLSALNQAWNEYETILK